MSTSEPQAIVGSGLASVKLDRLDNLWFQVAGTLCNLRCSHCFISCSPENDRFRMMTLQQIRPYLHEAVQLGVKEFYFTGGEPFLNPEIFDILEEALAIGPASVLTNGTIITARRASRLARLDEQSIYSLEVRVSLDGFDAPSNDRLRGKGSFGRAMRGISRLVGRGMLPIVTAVQTWDQASHDETLERFLQLLRSYGYSRPRLKIIPALNLGEFQKNQSDSAETSLVSADMLDGFEMDQFICHNSRMVAHDGVYVCPILIDFPDARMGNTIAETTGDYQLRHPACHTCYLSGAICSNFSTGGRSER
ncbi:MAG: radical SAM protein [Candidatus Zixiibacteriota bacterium]